MQTTPYIQWPIPSKEELLFAIVGFVGFVILLIAFELHRQWYVRIRAVKREWATAEEIMADKDLGAREREILRDLLTRWAPKAPLQTITGRRHFERAVAAEMARAAAGPAEAFEAQGQALRDIRTKLGLDYAPIGQAILSTRDIYPAQILEMQDDGASGWSEFTVRRLNEAYLFLRPLNAPRPPAPGAYAKVRMWREEDARYAFNLRFERINPGDEAWVFHHSDDLNRYQARAHFRIFYDRTLPLIVAERPRKGAAETAAEIARIRGRITSLSAGGFAVQLQEPIDGKALLRTELDLEHIGVATVAGEIVAVHPGAAGRYLVRVQFIDLDDELRDVIARYVTFRQQAVHASDGEAH